jgi:hypothetical protein
MLDASDARKKILSPNVTLKTMSTLSNVLCGRKVLLTCELQSEHNQHCHISPRMNNNEAGLGETSCEVQIWRVKENHVYIKGS